jgi:hypothetical protein
MGTDAMVRQRLSRAAPPGVDRNLEAFSLVVSFGALLVLGG